MIFKVYFKPGRPIGLNLLLTVLTVLTAGSAQAWEIVKNGLLTTADTADKIIADKTRKTADKRVFSADKLLTDLRLAIYKIIIMKKSNSYLIYIAIASNWNYLLSALSAVKKNTSLQLMSKEKKTWIYQ